mmetsp:Transcript_24399/g.61179  ORF Transcript_24399/g.61179 Transcript_24399/m.61179 type:complete len:354 (-) Transcript_24399:1252-2313(-)|eukprot:CAMPEP_0177654168 /NCGR_PEP_ID=MMETSP0447-20121125/14160_1 /TAXON_ID=0 /ORGANISM="Stygamoeba regulata, Strain BSH-02190019" /LENGTH=353 /DNA_ID=CAMNT_0019157743 /DNA_START=92 /DNA_END=1153 /DNA_ORIENTATION=-
MADRRSSREGVAGSAPCDLHLRHVSFNQKQDCFACTTSRGFIVYNCDPLAERFRHDFGKGVRLVEMLERCNILALVGGGEGEMFPNNKVMLWDDYQKKCIVELDFRGDVRAVRLRKDRIVVATEDRVFVYTFSDLQPLQQVETYPNPTGILALSPMGDGVLACPGLNAGYVHVEHLGTHQTCMIPAHENPLSQIQLSVDGTLLATASEKGTLIRIFSTATGTQLRELRRGIDRALIYCISFNLSNSMLCVTSDKPTVHIFSLLDESSQNRTTKENVKSSLSFIKGVFPVYGSEWSFAQCRLPFATPTMCAFVADKSEVIVICKTGYFYRFTFDPAKGGEGIQQGSTNLLKAPT